MTELCQWSGSDWHGHLASPELPSPMGLYSAMPLAQETKRLQQPTGWKSTKYMEFRTLNHNMEDLVLTRMVHTELYQEENKGLSC